MKLYLDDVRPVPDGWELHTTAGSAIARLQLGDVTHISFDHDLGPVEAGTGYVVACWIEERAFTGTLPRMAWGIHSANPVGRENITRAMEAAERFWRK